MPGVDDEEGMHSLSRKNRNINHHTLTYSHASSREVTAVQYPLFFFFKKKKSLKSIRLSPILKSFHSITQIITIGKQTAPLPHAVCDVHARMAL